MTDLLTVRGLRVDLSGAPGVLDGVDLTVASGEIVAVIGASGAGKSVLARTLLGLHRRRVVADEFSVGGEDARAFGARDWRRVRGSRLGLVLQDALGSLDPLRTVAAEVGEAAAVHGLRGAARDDAVRSALADTGFPAGRERARAYELSGGLRQRALIASALSAGADVLIADEPTTALDAVTAARVLTLFRALRDEGRGIVLITHDLGAVARIADRVVILDAGRVVESGPTGRILDAPEHPATRALRDAIPTGPNPDARDTAGELLLEADELERTYRRRNTRVQALQGVSLRLHRGETLGVVGESGSGKSTLARLLIGVEEPDAGTLRWPSGRPRVRFVPQDPLASFDPRHRVGRILQDAAGRDGRSPAALLADVGLAAGIARRRPVTLSGGQRQRVAIARALAADPDVLVCDEAVSALDVVTQAEILVLLRRLRRERGLTLVFVSHDLAVVRSVSDRVLVLRDGRTVETGDVEQVWRSPGDAYTRELIAAAAELDA